MNLNKFTEQLNWRTITFFFVVTEIIVLLVMYAFVGVSFSWLCYHCPYNDEGYLTEWKHYHEKDEIGYCYNFRGTNMTYNMTYSDREVKFKTSCVAVWIVLWVVFCLSNLLTFVACNVRDKEQIEGLPFHIKQEDEI